MVGITQGPLVRRGSMFCFGLVCLGAAYFDIVEAYGESGGVRPYGTVPWRYTLPLAAVGLLFLIFALLPAPAS